MPTQFDTHLPKRKLYKWATVNNKIPCTSFCLYTEQWSHWFSFLWFSGYTVLREMTEIQRKRKMQTEKSMASKLRFNCIKYKIHRLCHLECSRIWPFRRLAKELNRYTQPTPKRTVKNKKYLCRRHLSI